MVFRKLSQLGHVFVPMSFFHNTFEINGTAGGAATYCRLAREGRGGV